MKIHKVRLQNIKSYIDQEIVFHDGVNFISGINGAGKSTLIEAVGFAMFDYKPGSYSEFVRYGAKSGTISVEFSANDEREYRVVRKIHSASSASSWNVFDLESGGELDLHGTGDVKAWLKEVLGVDRDMELDQLFQDVVGVPQGTFVGPFLETPSIRKKKFDSILKVEQYRDSYLQTKAAVGYLKDRINGRKHGLDLMNERVKDYDALKKEMSDLAVQTEELSSRLKTLKDSLGDKDKEVRAIEKTRTRLEETRNRLKIAELKGATLRERIAELETALQRAEEAANTVTRSEKGYRDYLSLEEQLGKLEQRRLEKEVLEKEYNRSKQEITRIEAEISAREESHRRQQDEAQKNRELLFKQMKGLETAKESAARELEETKRGMAGLDVWKQAEEDVGRVSLQLAQLLRDVESRENQLAEVSREETVLSEGLKNLPGVKQDAELFDEREKALQEARKQYEILKAGLRTLEENLQQSKGGLCPFLHTPCMNVQGDLETYFAGQIAGTEQKMMAAAEQGRELKDAFEKAKIARDRLIMLSQDEARLGQVREQKNRLSGEIKALFGQAASLPAAVLLGRLKQVSGEDFPRLDEACSAFREMPSEAGPAGVKACADKVAACLENVHEESRRRRNAREKALLLELDKRSGRLSTAETEYKNAGMSLEKIAEKEKWLLEEKRSIEIMAADGGKLKELTVETENRLAGYRGLSDEIGRLRSLQEESRKDYEAYIGNLPEAGKVEQLKAGIAGLQADTADNTAHMKSLQEDARQLETGFEPGEYEKKKQELDLLKKEEAKEQQVLVERRNDLQERGIRLREMDKVLAEMEELRQKLAVDEKTLRLLEIVRGILNNAGPPIARVYLENLSREANDLYRQISRENVALEWREGYDIVLVDNYQGKKRERSFKQCSGGEQMTSALAVRLALLKQQTGVKVGFFDEPTANLDSERRINLAETIPHVTGSFNQIFIISHDDTFDSMTDNIIQLQKDNGSGSHLLGQ